MNLKRFLALGTLVAVVATTAVVSAPTEAATTNRVTPGNFKGLGFDQCETPSQSAMDTWKRSSPFSAVGIYISGNSRFCKRQANLTPSWVSRQLANGWHLLPITLGPQAQCSARFPRYGARIDPTISGSKAYTYATARAQGRAEAVKAVSAARALGIVPGSTLFYDLEGWDLTHSTACNYSALWFLSSWSNELHRQRYLSGVYSSTGSGMKILDSARRNPPARYVGPDLIWLACWDGLRNTSANTDRCAHFSDAGWSNHQRIKQYRGGHDETWPKKPKRDRVTINIDRDYLDVRTRAVPGPIAEPAGPPRGQDTSKCTSTSISRPAYRRTSATKNRALVVPLQCLLTQQHLYKANVTGRWNSATLTALRAFQRAHGHHVGTAATRSDWISLITLGSSTRTLRKGARGADVIRVQRAINAATGRRLTVTGKFNAATRRGVLAYRKKLHLGAHPVVNSRVWHALHRGRW